MARQPLKKAQLRAYPQSQTAVPGTQVMTAVAIARTPNARNSVRRHLGRSISMDAIDFALRAAYRGAMQPITDLSRETVDMDPHLGSVLNKRFGALSSLPWEVVPASGYNVNTEKAHYYAEVVREQLKCMRNFRRMLLQMAWALFDGRAAQELQWVETPGAMSSAFGSVNLSVFCANWIHPRRLSFGQTRELRVVDEQFGFSGDFSRYGLDLSSIPYKFITWLPQLFSEYPEREGLAPRCMYWSFFKRYGARDRMILLELFGKPWRIAEIDEDYSGSDDDLNDLDDTLDALGNSSTARLPRGVKVNVVQPSKTAGAVHDDVIKTSDEQISKLVLGQTATTDAAPAGLNSNTANVMQDEQLMILTRDARELSERIEECLCDAIIAVNFGPEAVTHAPHFVLRSDLPTDRTQELGRLKLAIDAGLSIAVSEAYEISGFRQPDEDEVQLRMEQPATPPNSPVAPAARSVIVYPKGMSPSAGEQQPSPAIAGQEPGSAPTPGAPVGAPDATKTIKVNEDRTARGLPALTLPDGSPDPDGELTVAEYDAKHAAKHTQAKSDEAAAAVGAMNVVIAARAIDAISDMVPNADILAALGASFATTRGLHGSAFVRAAHDHKQPETKNGSPETLLSKAITEVRPIVRRMVSQFVTATAGLDTVPEIFGALSRARTEMDVRPVARALERRMVQAVALGALDGADDTGFGAQPTKMVHAASSFPGNFAQMPFADALKVFREKNVLPRHLFDRLEAKAKLRAFTVSGKLADDMLAAVHTELVAQVADGADLRAFSGAIEKRMGEAGFLPTMQTLGNGQAVLSASHVETVFRTNVLGAMGSGRAKQMSQPNVVKARPIWEIRGVDDGHTRKTHADAHGKMLLASDPFWQHAYPPFGFNCRCRVIARPATFMEQVVSGSTLGYLPDPDFASGINSLLDV